MSIYQDFDYDEKQDDNKKKGKKNIFVFETFNDRMKKIKVRLTNNLQNDISFLKVENKETFKYADTESNFLTMLTREKVLNATPEFTQFLFDLKPFTGSYIQMINNSLKLITLFGETLEKELNTKNEDGAQIDRLTENAINQRNYPFIQSVLEVMIGFIKDIREDASETFLNIILPNLIKLLVNSANTEVIDKTFSVLVNVFKFLHKGIQKNFKNFFLIFSELLFNKNKSIRKFSCESICFLIKSLDKEELSDCLQIIFEVFNNPEIIFIDTKLPAERTCKTNFDDLLVEYSKNERHSAKAFIYKAILNFRHENGRDTTEFENLYIFLINSISDLLFEILLGINKTLSIRADLILDKIYLCFENNPYLKFMKDLTVTEAILKLFNYVTDQQKKNVIGLFHYYLSLNTNKNMTYPKLNIDSLTNQLDQIGVSEFSNTLQVVSYTFIREFIIKFYNKADTKIFGYLIDFFRKLKGENNNRIFMVEIVCLLLKLNSKELDNSYKFLKNDDGTKEIIQILYDKNFTYFHLFLVNLKKLQNYTEFLSFAIFDKRKNISSENLYNEDYIQTYDENIVTLIFNNIINTIDFETITQILEVITTYEFLIMTCEASIKNFNFTYSSKKVITDYLNKFNLEIVDFNMDNYTTLYSYIILLRLIDNNTFGKNFLKKILDLLEETNTNSIIMKELRNKEYFEVLFSEFNELSVYFSSKSHSLFNLLDYFVTICPGIVVTDSIERIVKLVMKNQTEVISYKILNCLIDTNFGGKMEDFKIFLKTKLNLELKEDFIINTSKCLLIRDNTYKLEYVKFIKCYFFDYSVQNDSGVAATLINEIFTNMEETMEIQFDLKNDKKYIFNFEILISKLDSLVINKDTYNFIYFIIFYYLAGSYWIRYTKSVWGTLTKNLERFYQIINDKSKKLDVYSETNLKFFVLLKKEITNHHLDMFSLIQHTGTSEDLLTKLGASSKIISNYYLSFDNKNLSKDNMLKENLIKLTFLSKQDELSSIGLLYDGYLQGLSGFSYFLNTNVEIMQSFLVSVTDHLKICAGKNELFNTTNDYADNFYYCLFNNYVMDKEHKSGALQKKFVDSLLNVLSKTHLNSLYKLKDFESKKHIPFLKNILYQHVVISKSVQIQKYCVCILINLEDRLKNYKTLLESIIDNTNVIERLHNLEKLTSDNGSIIKPTEREILIPLLIRLYYSKYFYLSQDNKKLRTKNKINLVSFFIQLSRVEFNEYLKIVFEPLSNCFENYELSNDIIFKNENDIENFETFFNSKFKYFNYDLRAFKKILEILTLNLKQITNLFENSVSFISHFITKCLIFLKSLNSHVKSFNDKKEKFFNEFYDSLSKTNVKNTKYINYFDETGLSEYIHFFSKNIKEIKKQSFVLLKCVINKFYSKQTLISHVTQEICKKYRGKEGYDFSTLKKPNSMLEFFTSFAKNPNLHFIYAENENLLLSILQILQNENIEEQMLNPNLDFLTLLLKPYYNFRYEFANEKIERNEVNDVEMEENVDNDSMNIENDENNNSNNGVIIEELNMNDDEDEDIFTNNYTMTKEILARNEEKIILNNFAVINDNLLLLVKNKKISLTIKDFKTRHVLEILVFLWNLFNPSLRENIKQDSVKKLFHFITNLLRFDNKIMKFQNKETLSDVLKICHMLLKIYPKEKNSYYRDFLNLLYKVNDDDSINRLIITLILQEFADYYGDASEFNIILSLLTNLNALKKRGTSKFTLDSANSNLDLDNTIDKLNELTAEPLAGIKFYHLEPLIYQMIVFTRIEDYSLQTISTNKLKTLFESQSSKLKDILANKANQNETNTFNLVMETFYNIIGGEKKSNINLSKTILEIISHLNCLIGLDYEILCSDLYKLKLDDDYNFFEAILNLKYEVRISAIKALIMYETIGKLNYFSVIRIILPIIKSFLSPFTYIKKQFGSIGHNAYKLEKEINHLVNETVGVLPILCKTLDLSDLKELIVYFQNQINRTNKKQLQSDFTIIDNNEHIQVDLQNILYKSLTKMIEVVIHLHFSDRFNFDKEFSKVMLVNIDEFNMLNLTKLKGNEDINMDFEKASANNRELIKKSFEALSVEYNKQKDGINQNYILKDIFNILKHEIYKTLKYILVDPTKKEKNKSYYLRNYAIRPFIQLLKLIDPYQIKYELIQLNYELINNLKNRDLSVREKTREGLRIFIESSGVYTSSIILDELKSQLHSGYQRYIKGYTCNMIINHINNNFPPEDVTKILTFSSGLVMPILLDELFGEVAEEMEIEHLVKKYKEARHTKAFNTLFVMCSKVDIKNTLVNIIYPFWSFLIKRDNDIDVFNKVTESINHMVKGFKNNPLLTYEDIIGYSNGLIKLGIDINIKNAKEIVASSKVNQKGEECEIKKRGKLYNEKMNENFTLQVGVTNGKNYVMQISEKFINNKNEVVLSNIFTGLGLDIFLICIKKKMFDFSVLSKDGTNSNNFTNDQFDNLVVILGNIINCLEISNGNIVSKSLKILTRLFDCKIFVIKNNLRKIVKHLFRNLNVINSQDISMSQTILSAIGDILSKFKYTDISDNKLKVLINFIKLNSNNSQIKPYVYSCFLSIIKRKILHPTIYDMITFIQETYLTSFEENTLTLCQNIIIEFLDKYPLEEKRIISHINFFVINLESQTRKCVLNSLKMIYKFFEVFHAKEFMSGLVDFIILKLLTILTNSDDFEVKELINTNLEKIFSEMDTKKEEGYVSKALIWLDSKVNKDRCLLKLSLNLVSIFTNSFKPSIEAKANKFRDKILELLKREINDFEIELEQKLEQQQYENEQKDTNDLDNLFLSKERNEEDQKHNLTVLKVQIDNWDYLYICFIILEKIHKFYPNSMKSLLKSNEFFRCIFTCLKHPHVFIKTIVMRFLNTILLTHTNLNTLFNNNYLELYFTNCVFFLISKDLNEKLTNLFIDNSCILIEMINRMQENSYFNLSLEFVCRLYSESKNQLNNKEAGCIIVTRVLDFFEKLICNLKEEALVNYIDPILNLCVKVSHNRLVDNSIQEKSEKILADLKSKINPDLVANKFNEIKGSINLLKRKRKIDIMSNSLSNPKEFLRKKYKK